MKIIGERSLSTFVKYLLDLILLGGIVIFISLPLSLKWYLYSTYGIVTNFVFYFLLALLYITGFFAILIVNEIRRIFKSLNKNDPFVMENSISLRNMGIYAFIISFCYIFKIIFFNSIATVIIIMIFVIAGFFSIILSEVFRQAVIAKQENDYTI